jgi:hypothetical protein
MLKKARFPRVAEYALWAMAATVVLSTLLVKRTASAEISLKPYTAVLQETMYASDGSSQPGVTNTTAARSDGSSVHRTTDPYSATTHRFIQFANGAKVYVNDDARLKSSTWVGPQPSRRDPASQCVNTFDGKPAAQGQVLLGQDNIAGVRASKIQIASPSRTATLWAAPDYGCAFIKVRVEFDDHGVSDQNIVTLIPGEPQASFFDLNGYSEVPPSKLRAPCDGCDTEARARRLQRRDAWYYAHRGGQGQ